MMTLLLIIIGVIAVLGLGLLAMLAFGAWQSLVPYRIKRDKILGFSDLLNYAALVEDGVVVNKDGSLLAAWVYRGLDAASSTAQAQELLTLRLNQALQSLGQGWMLHVDAVRMAAPQYSAASRSYFPDPVAAAVDAERRQMFETTDTLYDGMTVLTATWLPPSIVQRKFVALMFQDNTPKPSRRAQTLAVLRQFQQACDDLQTRLSVVLDLERLKLDGKFDQLLQWLQFCLTGVNHPLQLPRNPIYLDGLLGGEELWTGVEPKLGTKYIQVVALDGLPLESEPGLLTALSELPFNYRWSSRFIFLEQHEAVAHLNKFRKEWRQKIRSFRDQLFRTNSGVVDEDALEMTQDAASAIAETNSGLVAQGFYTSVVILMDQDLTVLQQQANTLIKLLNRLGFNARLETINTMEAYLGALPGHAMNVRRPLLNTLNFADLMPTSFIWAGENRAPSPHYATDAPPLMQVITDGNAPFWLNLHVRDLGHTLMFGPTRAGKSTHLAMLALQFRRYAKSQIFAFDKGRSMYATCLATGGTHYELTHDLAFAPLANLGGRITWALDWLESLFTLNGVVIDATRRNTINAALDNMAQSAGDTSLSDLQLLLQDEELRAALAPYCVGGAMGHLLDAKVDGFNRSDFMTFELSALLELGDKFALPVLLYLFHRLELALDGRPTFIILDEAWLALGHPVFAKRVAQWLRTLAKHNCHVLLATQNIADALQSNLLNIILGSVATKIFLPNFNALTVDYALYQQLGLNDTQINLIAQAVPKRDYYYVSELGSRLYRLALGPLALAFVGAGDPDSIATIKQLSAQPDWVDQWLATKNLTLDAHRSTLEEAV